MELGGGRVKSFRLSDTLSPPKSMDEIQSNFVRVSLINVAFNSTFWPAPGVLGKAQNVGYH